MKNVDPKELSEFVTEFIIRNSKRGAGNTRVFTSNYTKSNKSKRLNKVKRLLEEREA